MRPREFGAGDQFMAGGVAFRVVHGEKGPDDLRLDWLVNGYWQPVILDAVFAVVDMVAQNEDLLYPFPARGGEEVIRYLRLAREVGWQRAALQLQKARAEKQRKLEEGPELGEGDQ